MVASPGSTTAPTTGMDDSPRLVTVWCVDWPVVAAGAPPDAPAAVFHANRVVARTPAAAAAGVAHGDRRRSAQGACPELQVLPHDPARDARAFEPVMRAVADLAPRLEIVEPGWLSLAARGPSRYFGGDQALAERLAALVHEVLAGPVRVGVGVADGRAASAIAARTARGGTRVVPPGGSVEFLADRPVAWLARLGDATPELVDLFVRLGLRTFGHLAALAPADVLSRFGPEGLLAHRVATAADTRPAAATDPPPEWTCEHTFDTPVADTGPVAFVAKRLADDLTGRLTAAGQVCTRLVVTFETEHGERSERAWYRAHGLSAAAVVERVRWQLAGWIDDGDLSAGVALLRLTPDEVRRDAGEQARLWGGRSQADADAVRAVARLSGLAGERAVCVPEWAGGRLPGERYRLVPATSVELDDATSQRDRLQPELAGAPWPGATVRPAPAVVAPEPAPAELLDAAGRPVRVGGRGELSGPPAVLVIGNRRGEVAGWAGPWPIEQRWWSPRHARRLARMQVVTVDGDAHLIAVERGRWTVLATYA
jgi:protein ImuB